MKTITVKHVIPRPIEQAFDCMTDHANYKLFPGITDSKLEVEGKPEKNGLGAVRWVKASGLWFREKITAYDRPRTFTYLITESALPMEHEGGTLTFKPVAGGTEVTWVSRARVKLPIVGGLLTNVLVGKLEAGFAATLRAVERRVPA